MSMKVFSFVGSQAGEKSNTARFSDMVAEKLKEHAAKLGEEVTYERLTGADVRLTFCRSCQNCFKTDYPCPADAHDDLPLLKQKFLEADVIFFCSPVYTGSMSATSKAVIDRLACWCHRAELAGKTAAVLVTTCNNHGPQTVAGITEAFYFMGASVACGTVVNTSATPNLYRKEDMEPLTEKLCSALIDCWQHPETYITKNQNLSFYYLARGYERARRVYETIGRKLAGDARVGVEREFIKYKTLKNYVEALRGTARTEDADSEAADGPSLQ